MIINRFSKISGTTITEINGQDKLAFSLSTFDSFYDLLEWPQVGKHPGGTISFYNLETGHVDTPFSIKPNTLYGNVVFSKDGYYFLKYDHDEKEIVLYKYTVDGSVEEITSLDSNYMDLYNLSVIGDNIHIISQDENFTCYFPEKFTFKMNQREAVLHIAGEKVYLCRWVEEGWDCKKNCPSDQYKYYDMLVIRDFGGNILSEEVGVLQQISDGRWWIS